jgi:cyclopropane-fatty-acyl-phospholipid synthase
MQALIKRLFAELIKSGSLEIEMAGGHKFMIGDGSGQRLKLRFNDTAAPLLLVLDPRVRFGELYVDGRIDVTEGTLFDLLMLAAANMWRPDGSRWVRLLQKGRTALRWLGPLNDLQRAKHNTEHHYDLDAISIAKTSTQGCNIRALISNALVKISKLPRPPRSGISRPSS